MNHLCPLVEGDPPPRHGVTMGVELNLGTPLPTKGAKRGIEALKTTDNKTFMRFCFEGARFCWIKGSLKGDRAFGVLLV